MVTLKAGYRGKMPFYFARRIMDIGQLGARLIEPQFIVVYLFVISVLFVHFRGRVRLKLSRQFTDHSAFFAPYNTLVYLFSKVPPKPILPVSEFPDLARLRDNWQMIRDEALELFDEGHIRAAVGNNDAGFNSFFKYGWKRFYLTWYGDTLPSARQLCPRTVALIESIPTVKAAMFALLPPGGKLNPHRDPFGGSLRYHLGLVTPNSEQCRIFIDGEPYHWRDGHDIVFDETYVHSAENKTDVTRIILFCDIERPVRTPIMRAINHFVSRQVGRATATQNVEGERVGGLNKAFAYVKSLDDARKRLKNRSRAAYRALKFGALALLVFVLFA